MSRAVESNGPDCVRNGLALTATACLLFDRGLISVSVDLRLLVSPQELDRLGQLGSATSYRYGDFARRNGVAILDLDGRHAHDVVVGGDGLQAMTSTAQGHLELGMRVETPFGGTLVALDLDGSGSEDIASASWGDGGAIHMNPRDGTLGNAPWAASPQGYNSIAKGDLDGDGDADVVLASGQGMLPNVRLYRNDGTGTLTEFGALDAACGGLFARGIGVGDVTGDGRADVVAADRGQPAWRVHPRICRIRWRCVRSCRDGPKL